MTVTAAVPRTPDEIWADDLFGRGDEAEALLAFLESIYEMPQLNKDSGGYTLAVDAEYGMGKSYFLRRLGEHLALNHPVAFVDAWKDDLADEPLTALAATLHSALDPLIKQSQPLRSKLKSVIAKTGKVVKIASAGLFKKGISIAITAGSTEAIEHALGASAEIHRALENSAKTSGKDAVEGLTKIHDLVTENSNMELRIKDFKSRPICNGRFAGEFDILS